MDRNQNTEDKLVSGGADFQNHYVWLQSQQWRMLRGSNTAESLNIGHYSDVHMEYGKNYLKYAWGFVQVRQIEREKSPFHHLLLVKNVLLNITKMFTNLLPVCSKFPFQELLPGMSLNIPTASSHSHLLFLYTKPKRHIYLKFLSKF